MIQTSSRDVLTPPDSVSEFLYEPFYGLSEKPFSLSSDPRFLYKSPAHAAAFDDLLRAIRRREGLIVLTGDIGTGKTTLCRAVLEHLDRKTFTAFVPDPFVTREDLLKMLLIDFGVMSVDDLRSGRLQGVSRPDLSYPLYEFLKSLQPLHAFAVLVIDEAQNVPLPLLEEIRILSDLEDREKLLQVVLVGQLELRTHLKQPEMRQVDQRVSVRCELGPLTRDGVAEYIRHRLWVAGGAPDRQPFSPEAFDEVYKASRGVPRVINLICDRALLRGYEQQTPVVGPDLIARAVIELDLGSLMPGIPEPASANPESVAASAESSPLDNGAENDEMPEEIDLEVLTEFEAPPRQLFAGDDDEFEELEGSEDNISTGGSRTRGTFLGVEMADEIDGVGRTNAARGGESESRGHVFLRHAARAAALLMLVAALAWGGWQLWSRVSRPSSPIEAPITATPPAPVSEPAVPPVASGPTPAASAPSLLTDPLLPDPLLTSDPTVPADPSSVADPADRIPAPSRRLEARSSAPPPSVPEPSRITPRAPAVEQSGWEYIVQVATLSSAESASALVRRLTNSGFRAYQTEVDLGSGERVQRVFVGRYGSRAQAELASTLIRQMPGFSDAMVLPVDSSTPAATTAASQP